MCNDMLGRDKLQKEGSVDMIASLFISYMHPTYVVKQ